MLSRMFHVCLQASAMKQDQRIKLRDIAGREFYVPSLIGGL